MHSNMPNCTWLSKTILLEKGPLDVRELPAQPSDDMAPLVLLHEGLGSVGLWRSFPTDLAVATGRRTIVYSRHGHGRSAAASRERSVDYLHHEARVVLPALLTELHVEHPVLVGHSDGASIALIAAGESTVQPAGLALFAPHVIVEDVTVAGVKAARQTYEQTDLRQRLGRHHDDVDALFIAWNDIWLSKAFRDWDITDVLAGVSCPVLAVQGQQDQYATLRQFDLIDAGLPSSLQRIVLDDCRHAPHLDQPQATLAAVSKFVASLSY